MTGEKTGEIQVFVILPSFCDLVHIQNVIDPFAKQLNNALNVDIITKIRAIFHKYQSRRGVTKSHGILRGKVLKLHVTLFWFSNTATLFSRHLMYSFFLFLKNKYKLPLTNHSYPSILLNKNLPLFID